MARTSLLLALLVTLVAGPSCGPRATVTPGGHVSETRFVVDDESDRALEPGPPACGNHRTPGLHCTLRAAVAAANRVDHAVIRLPPGTYGRVVDRPLVIERDMTISGAGMHASVIDARRLGRVFALGNSRLRLRDLAVTNGHRRSPAAPGTTLGNVAMENVVVADTATGIGRATHGSWVRSCVLLRNERADFFRRAVFSDATALGSLAGDPF